MEQLLKFKVIGQGMIYMGNGGNKYTQLSINYLDSPSQPRVRLLINCVKKEWFLFFE